MAGMSRASLRAYLLRVATVRLPCPACTQRVSYLEAARIQPDQLTLRDEERPQLRCPHCGVELEEEVLFTGGRLAGRAVMMGTAMSWQTAGSVH